MTASRVSISMSRSFAALALGLALVAGACGGKKGGKTTPDPAKTGSGDDPSMKDPGDPTGGGTGSAGDPGGTGGTAGGTTDPTDGPKIVPPNLDPDPAQAKTQVDAHLVIAKNALSQATPDADTALREARAALAIDAANVDAASYVAFAYYHKKLYDTAELVLDDMFRREAAKNNANVYYVYGLVYDKTNRPEKARVAYQKAVELDPRHASALVNLGVHQLKNSQYAEAQTTFEKLTKEFRRNDAITLTSLGSAYRGRSADYPQGAAEREQFVRTAEAAYKRALSVNPNYGPAYYNLGLLYLDTDPMPGVPDTMARLNAAKAFFDQYKNMPGVDMKLYDSRMKDVDKAIKREDKRRKAEQKKKAKDAKSPAPKTP